MLALRQVKRKIKIHLAASDSQEATKVARASVTAVRRDEQPHRAQSGAQRNERRAHVRPVGEDGENEGVYRSEDVGLEAV